MNTIKIKGGCKVVFTVVEDSTSEVLSLIDLDKDLIVHKTGYSVLTEENTPTLKVKFFDKDIYPNGLSFIDNKSDWIDLRARKEIVFADKGVYFPIPLGVAIELPKRYEAIVAPRSSLFKNHGLICTNSLGIIDESYCGDNDEWHFLCYSTRETKILAGERICQFRIIKHQPQFNIQVVDKLHNSDRKGLGSTGKK